MTEEKEKVDGDAKGTYSDPIQLLDYIVRCLVKKTNDVTITPVDGPYSLVLELRVSNDEMGAIIGKNGKIAKAVRNLFDALPSKKVLLNNELRMFRKINLEIVD